MNVAVWNALDWVLAAVLVLSVAAGFWRGLVRTVLGLAGYAGGFMLAGLEYAQAGDRMRSLGWIESPVTARVLAYVLIVAVVVVCVELIARLVHRTVQAVGLSFFNRVLGAGFGLVRGLIAGMVLLMIPADLAPRSTLVTKSVLSPYFFAMTHEVSFLVPEYLQHRVRRDGRF
ncbi:MAG TPA: CvpA family protein [Acidobacteriaceae bacterium]|nr:CvpA family protein [Acidobacteriaceae bacterium]